MHVQVVTETRAMLFWRAVNAELKLLAEPPAALPEVDTLFLCGYSVAQAVRILAPGKRPALRLVSNF